MCKRIFLCLNFLVFTITIQTAKAQDANVLLQNSLSDGTKLLEGYISPFMNSLSIGVCQGWYNTAETHKKFGVDLTLSLSGVKIPDDEFFYDISALNLQEIELASGSPNAPMAPTAFGPDITPIYQLKGDPGSQFDGPPGIDLKSEIGNRVPVPMASLGIGLPKGIDLKIRFVPTLDVGGDAEFKMFGLGVMHNIKQYIPGLKNLPFDVSGFVGFTRLSMTYFYDGDEPAGDNQTGEFKMSATTIQGIISKKIAVLTGYAALGYNIARSNLAMKGTYDLDGDGNWDDPGEVDPIDLKFGASGPRLTLGARLKLAILTLHADYTVQKYSTLTVGVGLSVR